MMSVNINASDAYQYSTSAGVIAKAGSGKQEAEVRARAVRHSTAQIELEKVPTTCTHSPSTGIIMIDHSTS